MFSVEAEETINGVKVQEGLQFLLLWVFCSNFNLH